ncbi:MAG: sensor histidine kinase [Alloprevotella sp.]
MKHIRLCTDLVFCLVILPLLLFAFPVERWWGTQPLYFAAFTAWLYVTYFTYKYFIVPRLTDASRRTMWQALTVMAVSLAVTYFFSIHEISSPFYHLRQANPQQFSFPRWGVRQNQQAVWLHYILVAVFCFAVGMLQEAYRQRLAREEMENERNKAALALYKAQINPHFLFNTLNTLYGLLITHSDKTASALEQFIGLTKYMFQNAERDFIPLSQEVDYVRQYVALQQLRLNELAHVSFSHSVADGATLVPPMMCITFVENAFKHGISSSDPCFVSIRMEQDGNEVRLRVENSVFDRPRDDSFRVGMENCRHRLALLYPGRHRLQTGITPQHTFLAELVLTN